jgi:4-hydroxybutyrate CoA-transferase
MPQDWHAEFRRRLIEVEAAADLVQRGDALYTPMGADAETFLHALLPRLLDDPKLFKIRACSPRAAQEWFAADFDWLGADLGLEIFGGAVGRDAIETHRADYTPNIFSNQFNIYDHRPGDVQSIDVFATTCTPPDDDGYVDFGSQPWHKGDFARRARTSIFEVVPWIPRCRTTERMHVTEVTAFIETAMTGRPPSRERSIPPEAAAVAGFIGEIVQDGDTLQIGVGRATTSIAEFGAFEGRRDLGWHSEMTPVGVVPLMMNGVMNGSRKTLDPGLAVTTTVNPRDNVEAEEWIASSGLIETRAVREVTSIPTIATQEGMCAINSALQVDLTGQICSESRGTTVYNGTGGQPEFHIGAFVAPRGKAITVVPSTFAGGSQSRIVPMIDDGTFVTIPRIFADFVVTEFGIARLAGKSQRERAAELIAVAHPDHRADLERARQRQFFPAPVSEPASSSAGD